MTAENGSALNRLPRIYLAGKIDHKDWRHLIFPDLSECSAFCRHCDWDYYSEPKSVGGDVKFPDPVDGFNYCGPFFVSDDNSHSSNHGENTHGIIGGYGCTDRNSVVSAPSSEVLNLCCQWIDWADIVFVYIDDSAPYGTVFELGYAWAKGKPFFVAYRDSGGFKHEEIEEVRRDTWLCRSGAQKVIGAPDAPSAWNYFTRWYRDEFRLAKRYLPLPEVFHRANHQIPSPPKPIGSAIDFPTELPCPSCPKCLDLVQEIDLHSRIAYLRGVTDALRSASSWIARAGRLMKAKNLIVRSAELASEIPPLPENDSPRRVVEAIESKLFGRRLKPANGRHPR